MCFTRPPQHTNARANIATQMLCVGSGANIETVAIWKSARCPRHVCWLPVAKQCGSVNQHGVTTRDGGLNLNNLNKDNQGWWLEHLLARFFDNKDNQIWRSRWSFCFKAVPLFFEAVLCPFELIYYTRLCLYCHHYLRLNYRNHGFWSVKSLRVSPFKGESNINEIKSS